MSIKQRLMRMAASNQNIDVVTRVLDDIGAEYEIDDAGSVELDSIGGQISEVDGEIYFVLGNQEPHISVDSPDVSKWVKAYVEGREAFEELLKEYR